jgi:uncharacterized protein
MTDLNCDLNMRTKLCKENLKALLSCSLILVLFVQPLRADKEGALRAVEAKDYEKAANELMTLSDQQDPEADMWLGLIWMKNFKDPSKREQGFKRLERSARHGYAPAQGELGKYYLLGRYVKRDYSTALTWFEKAKEQDDKSGYFGLGTMYYYGWGVPRDLKRSLSCLQVSCTKGHDGACRNLGSIYGDGLEVRKDRSSAIKWLQIGVDAGGKESQYVMGIMCLKGLGVPPDSEKGIPLLMSSAEQGVVEAASFLGAAYYEGIGVPQNDEKALWWLGQAADQGEAQAQFAVGLMWHQGRGTKSNDSIAKDYFLRAAKQGLADAQTNLGLHYFHGLGVTKDWAQAFFWLSLAELQGKPGLEQKDEAAKELTQKQLLRIRDDLKNWRAVPERENDDIVLIGPQQTP